MSRLSEWVWVPGLLAAGIIIPGLAAPEAHADGVLDDAEAACVTDYADSAICPVLDYFPGRDGVLGVIDGITLDGFTPDDAADIVGAAVYEYCPRHSVILVEPTADAWTAVYT